MLRVRVVGLTTPVAATFQPSHERGGLSLVQEYPHRRMGLSVPLAALFRCRWLIAIPSCEAVRAVCVALECQKNRKSGWGDGFEPPESFPARQLPRLVRHPKMLGEGFEPPSVGS